MKKLIASIIAIILGLSSATAPAMATNSISEAAMTPITTFGDYDGIILDCDGDDNEGKCIKHIIKLAIDILTIAIGVVAVIGIVISGIQYITAGGNEEQTRKAKRRIFEIVIGLAAYAVIYLALYFLLPDFKGTAGL